ncbi:aminotransferase class IV family protein [Photobacterium sp. TY1-4]|uniref:aminotransferase class IV family protein n=1 Tax=Photobacterium sp. TY1-4 TaxID=2899122 RepID=UPI0021C25303|nr:aminotransferase class IV family protein [Photobacterium sp. TY1-4]UXI04556.1 aminotransferase class IV family protein [Photobacterium sp. TY1-4]
MSSEWKPLTLLNGRAATSDDLAPLAFAGHAHFTAMQVRDHQIRGLDLHLARLRTASLALYGQAISVEQVLTQLRQACALNPAHFSLMAYVYSASGEFTPAENNAQLSLLLRTAPPHNGPQGPLALKSFEYERILPQFKHVGEIGKTYWMRQAVADGFDDAVFIDRLGRYSEASIWNLAFWDGEAVIWPQAPVLPGTTLGIVRRQLDKLGMPQREQKLTQTDIAHFKGAVVMNSWTPAVPVRQIDTVSLPISEPFLSILHQAYRNEPLIAP